MASPGRCTLSLGIAGTEIVLEDIRFPWRANEILATIDAKGHFAISVFDGTEYRVHAVTMYRRFDRAASAEPLPIGPGADLSKPRRLVLTRQGNSIRDLAGKGLERWRAGIGF